MESAEAPTSETPEDPGDPKRADRRRALLWCALIVGVSLAVSWWWMHAWGFFHRPPTQDAAGYRLEVWRILQAGRSEGFLAALHQAFTYEARYPPGLAVSGWVLCAAAGVDPSPAALWASIALWFVASAAAFVGLARRWIEWKLVPVALLLFASMPLLLELRGPFLTQLPLVAVHLMAWNALIACGGFARLGPSLAFGFWNAAGLLIKATSPVYLIGGVLVAVVLALLRPEGRIRALRNAVLSALVPALLAGPWYLAHYEMIQAYTSSVVGAEGQQMWSSGLPMFSLERWLYYPAALLWEGAGFPFLVIVLPSLVFSRRTRARRPARPEAWVLVGSLVLGYVILTLGQVAGGALYLASFCPILAILAGHLLSRSGARRPLLVVGAVIVALTGFVAFSRCPVSDPVLLGTPSLPLVTRHDGFMSSFARRVRVHCRPEAEDWFGGEELRDLARVAGKPVPLYAPLADPWRNDSYLSHAHLIYEGERVGVPFRALDVFGMIAAGNAPALEAALRQIDFVMVDTGAFSLDQIEGHLARLGFSSTVVYHREFTPVASLAVLTLQDLPARGR